MRVLDGAGLVVQACVNAVMLPQQWPFAQYRPLPALFVFACEVWFCARCV